MAFIEGFSDDIDRHLITLVENYPILYNQAEADSRNAKRKEEIWRKIAAKLNKPGHLCKKRWKNIKDTYLRQIRRNKSCTNSKSTTNPKSKFNTYDRLLSFLHADLNDNTRISFSEDDINIQDGETVDKADDLASFLDMETDLNLEPNNIQAADIPVYYDPTSMSTDRKQDDLFGSVPTNQEVSDNAIVTVQNENVDLNDDLEVFTFTEHMKCVLRSLPPIAKVNAQKELYDILMKYKLTAVAHTNNNVNGLIVPTSPACTRTPEELSGSDID